MSVNRTDRREKFRLGRWRGCSDHSTTAVVLRGEVVFARVAIEHSRRGSCFHFTRRRYRVDGHDDSFGVAVLVSLVHYCVLIVVVVHRQTAMVVGGHFDDRIGRIVSHSVDVPAIANGCPHGAEHDSLLGVLLWFQQSYVHLSTYRANMSTNKRNKRYPFTFGTNKQNN